MYGSVETSPTNSRRGSAQNYDPQTPLLLPDDGDQASTEVKIDMPSQDDFIPEYPVEFAKTLLSFLFLIFGFIVTTFSLALTHERVPPRPPLPDIVLDNTTYHQWGLAASEVVIVLSLVVASVTVLLHTHRTIVFRRVALMAGLLYMYRGFTMFITVLPMSDPNYKCAPKLNHTITFLELVSRVATIVTGGGMSFSDNQKYCGDFIFSGHTMILLLCFFTVREYTPRRWLVLHLLTLAGLVLGVTMLLLSRGHYSIDVLVAYWVTSRLWWTYHSLAQSKELRIKGEHNKMDNIWWWYIFRYFESNVPPCPLPRVYSAPLPNSTIIWLQDRMGRIRGRRRLQEEEEDEQG